MEAIRNFDSHSSSIVIYVGHLFTERLSNTLFDKATGKSSGWCGNTNLHLMYFYSDGPIDEYETSCMESTRAESQGRRLDERLPGCRRTKLYRW